MSDNIDVWIVGAGLIAQEYAKILIELGIDPIIIGRGKESANRLSDSMNLEVVSGGINLFLDTKPSIPQYVIVAVNIEQLKEVAIALINYGIKNILLEKPGALNLDELSQIKDMVESHNNNSKVYIAYNRRFYEIVSELQQLISEDGGLTSFHFEFTEWSHEIVNLPQPPEVKENWLLANSSHVIDLAFFVGGTPKQLSAYTSGSLSWHSKSSIFTGSGVTSEGVLFSYNANWEAPGRWSLEFMTKKRRFILRPMEKIQVQNIGSVQVADYPVDLLVDNKFKPGFYNQVKSFIFDPSDNRLLDLQSHIEHVKRIYEVILGN